MTGVQTCALPIWGRTTHCHGPDHAKDHNPGQHQCQSAGAADDLSVSLVAAGSETHECPRDRKQNGRGGRGSSEPSDCPRISASNSNILKSTTAIQVCWEVPALPENPEELAFYDLSPEGLQRMQQFQGFVVFSNW